MAAALVALAAGCTTGGGDDAPEDRPTFSAGIEESEFCPTGEEVEELESVPQNDAMDMFYNGQNVTAAATSGGRTSGSGGTLHCGYFSMVSDDPVDRIEQDFATPSADLTVLETSVDPAAHPEVDRAAFPEAPDYFQVTGWEHTATEEETKICLSDVGLMYEECEDGRTLVMEVFTLTGYDSNVEYEIKVEYRFGGHPDEYGSDEAEEVEYRSREIAADFLRLISERLPATG
jgi:hypothetical protein